MYRAALSDSSPPARRSAASTLSACPCLSCRHSLVPSVSRGRHQGRSGHRPQPTGTPRHGESRRSAARPGTTRRTAASATPRRRPCTRRRRRARSPRRPVRAAADTPPASSPRRRPRCSPRPRSNAPSRPPCPGRPRCRVRAATARRPSPRACPPAAVPAGPAVSLRKAAPAWPCRPAPRTGSLPSLAACAA